MFVFVFVFGIVLEFEFVFMWIVYLLLVSTSIIRRLSLDAWLVQPSARAVSTSLSRLGFLLLGAPLGATRSIGSVTAPSWGLLPLWFVNMG